MPTGMKAPGFLSRKGNPTAVPIDSSTASSPAPAPVSPHKAVAGLAKVAGLSGIVFAGLFTASIVMVHRAPGLAVSDSVYTEFYAQKGGDALVTAGLYLVPLAGIAFLWHMMATHSLIVARGKPSPMPARLQFASGLGFVILVFTGMATAGGIALLTQFSVTTLPSVDVARALTAVGYGLVFVFGARFAGMYILTTTGLLKTAGLLPKPLVWLGYLTAAVVLTQWTFHPVFALIFPGWVLVVSAMLAFVPIAPKDADK